MNRRSHLFFASLAAASSALAQTPALNEIYPPGGRRGTTAEVVFSGTNLAETVAVLTTSPCKAELGKAVAGSVPVKIVIPENCPAGTFEFRLVTKTGVTGSRLFAVGDLPEIVEKEPNENVTAAQAITVPAVVSGKCSGIDIDCFAFTAKAGERLAFECDVRGLGSGTDPVLTLYDERGRDLATNEDHPATASKARFEHTFTTAGKYVLEVRESTYKGAGGNLYRLRIGPFANAVAAFPAGGKRGTTVPVSAITVPESPAAPSPVVVPADHPYDRMNIRLTVGGALSAEVPFAVGDYDEALEAEPNDAKAPQAIAATPVTVNGRIQAAGDIDGYAIAMKKGQALVFEVDAWKLGSRLDSVIAVLDAKGATVGTNDDDGARPDSKLAFTAPADGTFTVTVRDVNHRGAPDYVYRLTIAPPRPDFAITVGEDALTAAPDGAALITVNVARSNYAGQVDLEFEGLPKSVEREPQSMVEKGKTSASIALQPPADSPASGHLIRVVGVAEIDGRKVRRVGTSTTVIIPGAKNQPPVLVRQTVDLGFAVRIPAPYTLASKTPEVKVAAGDKAAKVPVTIKRSADAGDAVVLGAAGLPGKAAPDPKSGGIAKGAAEGTLVLNIPADIPPGRYHVVLTGTTKVKGADVGQTSRVFALVVEKAGGPAPKETKK